MLIKDLRERIERLDKERVAGVLNEVQNLDVFKHIGERGTSLAEEIVFNKRKTLIISPMACGKTTFSFSDLYSLARECFCQFIFVSPKVSLIQAMESKYKCNTCYGGQGITVNGLPVLTTPDSLYKVILSCEEQDKTFLIVVDEVHECELNYLHRHKLWKPFEAFEHENCVGVVGLTATPDNILKSIKWDSVIQVNPEQKFMQTPSTSIINNLGSDVESIVCHVFKTYMAQKRQTVVRVNDKNKIKEVKKLLEGLGIQNISVWFRDNPDEKDSAMLLKMLSGERNNFDILLTTSLVDVGVELYPEQKPIVIDFLDSNSRIIENIQFLGRFREGVEKYHMIVNSKPSDKPYQEYADILQELQDKAKRTKDFAEEEFKVIGLESKLLKSSYQIETDTYNYEVDPVAVNTTAFEIYIKQIICDTERLKRFLENHSTFNSGKIEVAKLPKDYVNIEQLKPLIEEMKADRKVLRDEKKANIESLVEFVSELNDRDFKLFTTKPDDILITDKWRIESFGEHYEFYWSEDMKNERKKYYFVLKFQKLDNLSSQELWLRAFNKTWYNDFKNQCLIVDSNYMYNNTAPIYKIDEAIDRTKIIVYDIRDILKGFKGKEAGVKLSDKLLNEILERLQGKKKQYSKWKAQKLRKYIELIYNVSNDKYRTITSVRTKISLDKELN